MCALESMKYHIMFCKIRTLMLQGIWYSSLCPELGGNLSILDKILYSFQK